MKKGVIPDTSSELVKKAGTPHLEMEAAITLRVCNS